MDGYMEHMVARKLTGVDLFIRILLVVLSFIITASFIILGPMMILLGGLMIFFTISIVFSRTYVEYEYLYCNRTISVDKIFAKSRRKKVGDYELDKVEIMAKADSDRLTDFNRRKVSVLDYSSKGNCGDDESYVIYYEGNVKIVLDLPEKFVKMIQNNAPRKVFMD